ncbi:MAG: primosomal protein N', partial [Oscillospiraceae bacterium]
NGDKSLYSEDFRACEKTFSLITQVVGRSGRSEKKGRAIIETASPQNDVIIDASNQDYDNFFRKKLKRENCVYIRRFVMFVLLGLLRKTNSM